MLNPHWLLMAILGSPLLPFPIPPVIKPLGCNKLVAASFVPVAVNSPARTKLDVTTPPPITIPAPLPVPVPPPRPFPFPLPLNRDSFPPGFYFGTSSAAYQVLVFKYIYKLSQKHLALIFTIINGFGFI